MGYGKLYVNYGYYYTGFRVFSIQLSLFWMLEQKGYYGFYYIWLNYGFLFIKFIIIAQALGLSHQFIMDHDCYCIRLLLQQTYVRLLLNPLNLLMVAGLLWLSKFYNQFIMVAITLRSLWFLLHKGSILWLLCWARYGCQLEIFKHVLDMKGV